MTVETSTSSITYTGSGTAGPFSVPFYFLEEDDLIVTKITIADSTRATLTLNTDYTVIGEADENGGSVTLTSSLSSSFRLEIVRSPDLLQMRDYTPSDPFPAESHEQALDKIHMILMRHAEQISDLEDAAEFAAGGDDLTINNLTINEDLTVLDDLTVAGDTTLNNLTVTGTLVLPAGSITSTHILDGTIQLVDLSEEVLQLLSGGVSSIPSAVYGLRGINTTGNEDTQYDLSATALVLFNPTANTALVDTTPGSVTVDIDTAGPAVNGRDQAAAFSSSSWLYFYRIWATGQTRKGLVSATAPEDGGPTLPTNYTHWAFCASVFLDSDGDLKPIRVIGSTHYYDDATFPVSGAGNVLADGTATTTTSVDVSDFVPPHALDFGLMVGTTITSASGDATVNTFLFGEDELAVANQNVAVHGITGNYTLNFPPVTMPNTDQTFEYKAVVTNGTNQKVNGYCVKYRVPNGDQ